MLYPLFYRSKLPIAQQNAYDVILDALQSNEDDVTLMPCGDINVLHDIIQAVNFDNPHLFFVDFGSWKAECSAKRWKITPKYYWSKEESDRKWDEVLKIFNFAVRFIGSEGSEYEREKRVHDYLARRVTYDKEAAEKHNDTKRSNTIYGIFTEHKGVCEGIAKATQMLLSALNIYCILVTGQSRLADVQEQGNHAWNLVKIDGEYSCLDVTWDVSLSKEGFVRYDYFNINERWMALDHVADRQDMPYCLSMSNEYYTKIGAAPVSREEIKKLIGAMRATAGSNFAIRYVGEGRIDEEEFLNICNSELARKASEPLMIKFNNNIVQKVYTCYLEAINNG